MSPKSLLILVVLVLVIILFTLLLIPSKKNHNQVNLNPFISTGKLINGNITPEEIKNALSREYPALAGNYNLTASEQYQIYLPKNYSAYGKYPLVLSYSIGPDQLASYADKHNFVLLAADVSVYAMAALREKATNDYSIDPDKVYLLGFSAGAYRSTFLFLTYPNKFRGALLASGGSMDTLQLAPGEQFKDKRVFMTLGENDYPENISSAKTLKDFLEKNGARAGLELRPASGHEYPSGKNEEMIKFILAE